MEWIGWYLEFYCHRNLNGLLKMPGPRYGNVGFDGFGDVPWDFKTHATDGKQHKIIVNDRVAILNALREYGAVGLILAIGHAQYDDEIGSFKQWHEELKGGKSAYTQAREARGARSRRRKAAFVVDRIDLIRFTDKTLSKCGEFQKGFRNSDGSPRATKVLLSTADIQDEVVGQVLIR
jgi:hypothetical protein